MEKQAFIDKALAEAVQKIEEEVGGLLGQEFSCRGHNGQFIDAATALGTLEEKGTVAEMAVSGDKEDKAFILLSLKDAILLGGTLILLPEEELEERCKTLDFDGELADSYGEIANIIAGVYTAVFSDRGTIKLHFKKTALQTFAPGATDAVPANSYYRSISNLEMEGTALGQMQVLFPCDIFELSPPQAEGKSEAQAADPDSAGAAQPESAGEGEYLDPTAAPQPTAGVESLEATAAGPQQGVSPLQAAAQAAAAKLKGDGASQTTDAPRDKDAGQQDQSGPSPLQAAAQAAAAKLGNNGPGEKPGQASLVGQHPLILIVSEDLETAEAFAEPLYSQGQDEVVCLNYQDSLKEAVAARKVRGVFLVMREVGERGFASAIKIKSALDPPPPMVVAGPQWTRSTVLKAVKYGACDVLITPVEANELLDKLNCHMGT